MLLSGSVWDCTRPSASTCKVRAWWLGSVMDVRCPAASLSWANRRAFPATAALTEAEAAQYSPIRFVSPGAAPSLIVHGDADTAVPIVEGETMYAALTKAGVPASFIRIEGAGHGFAGANLERASAAMVQWFERYLGVP